MVAVHCQAGAGMAARRSRGRGACCQGAAHRNVTKEKTSVSLHDETLYRAGSPENWRPIEVAKGAGVSPFIFGIRKSAMITSARRDPSTSSAS